MLAEQIHVEKDGRLTSHDRVGQNVERGLAGDGRLGRRRGGLRCVGQESGMEEAGGDEEFLEAT